MNSIETQLFDLLRQTHAVRDELWGVLNDGALKHSLGGNTLSLGALIKQMGEVEHVYTQSFKTFKQDFSYRNAEAGLENSVDKLRAWFKKLDEELLAALSGLSEEDIQGKMIDRGGWSAPVTMNYHIYREAVLMFLAQAVLYLKSLRIALPEQLSAWVG